MQKQKPKFKRLSLKEKIRNILRKIDILFPYLVVGGGMGSALYYPEAMKGVGALLVAYILARTAVNELAKEDPKKAKLAEKIANTTEKALKQLGVNEELKQVEKIIEENA